MSSRCPGMTDQREDDLKQGVAREWLSTADAARYLGLTPARIRAEFASGRLDGSKLGPHTLRFKREHLDALMNSHVVPARRRGGRAFPSRAGDEPDSRRVDVPGRNRLASAWTAGPSGGISPPCARTCRIGWAFVVPLRGFRRRQNSLLINERSWGE